MIWKCLFYIFSILELGWQGKWIWFSRLLQGRVCCGEFKEEVIVLKFLNTVKPC
jgi:hypothetical protein